MSARKMNKSATVELDDIADHLRHSVKSKPSTSTLRNVSKHVEVFRGKYLLEQLAEHDKIKIEDEDERLKLATNLLHRNYFIHVIKNPDKTERRAKLLPQKAPPSFDPKLKYIWVHEGSQTNRNIMLTCVIVGFLACCMFPIWPHFMKVGLWYISVTLLLFMLVFTTLRTIIFVVSWLCGYEFWVFPNLFDEEMSVCDSFKPTYTCESSEPGGGTSRLAVFIAIAAFVWWVATQPTDYDKFVSVQKDFLADLYSGALLADKSQEEMDKMDAVPTVEDLMAEEDDSGDMDLGDMDDDFGDGGGDGSGDFDENNEDDLDALMKEIRDEDPLAGETTMR